MAARVEAKVVVPTGGAAVSVSSGALASAVTCTLAAGSYYATAAGGVSSLPTVLTSTINAAVSPYPDNAASMAAAVGYGTWSAGWSFQIASGDDAGMFGGVTMTAVSTPTYSNTGPGHGGDLAVGFNSTDDGFSGGNVHNVGAATDLVLAWVGKFTTAGNIDLLGKYDGAGTAIGYVVVAETNQIRFRVFDGVDAVNSDAVVAVPTSEWHVGIAVIDRASNVCRVGIRTLTGLVTTLGSAASITAVGDLTNAAGLRVGDQDAYGCAGGAHLAAVYIGTGAGIATGLSTNLSTALTSFASAVSSAFTVSLSTTTGLVSCSNSFWPCSVSWTSTALRDLLGYDRNFDYPQTAAQMATALGYGTWTSGAGYLCNETSGNLASVFGTPATLTAAGLGYSALGPRGGTDKAVTFDTTDTASGTTSTFDAGASDDLILLWVAKMPTLGAATTNRIAIKFSGSAGFYVDAYGSDNRIVATVGDGVDAVAADALTGSSHPDAWHVGIAVLERATNKLRVATKGVFSGTAYTSSETSASAIGALTNGGTFSLGGGAASSAWTLGAFYIVTGSSVATGLSANLSTALSNFATYMKSQTGTEQAQGIWFPGCPLNLEGDPAVAPRVTDTRYSQSPTGYVLALSGNSYYRHRGLVWSHVARSQVWEAAATYTNGSYETFAKDAFYGMGHAWFTPASPVQIYWNDAGTDRALGYTFNSSAGVPGWSVINVSSTEPKKASGDWTGLWRIEFAEVIAEGS